MADSLVLPDASSVTPKKGGRKAKTGGKPARKRKSPAKAAATRARKATTKGKARKAKRSAKRSTSTSRSTSHLAGRIASAKGRSAMLSDVKPLAEIVGFGAAAAFAEKFAQSAGYPTTTKQVFSFLPAALDVDLRPVVGGISLLAGLARPGKLSAKWANHLKLAGVGVFGSWLTTKAESYGDTYGTQAKNKAFNVRPADGAAPTVPAGGIVVGRIGGASVGGPVERAQRLEERIERLQGKKAQVEAREGGRAHVGHRKGLVDNVERNVTPAEYARVYRETFGAR